ncbi:MAG TPA: peptidylprolyl isomerase, partial [Candidatus Kapabacteria bacterium]
MHRHITRTVLSWLSLFLLASQFLVHATASAQSASAAKSSDENGPWLIKWKGGEVTLPEFESAFQRMNGKPAYSTTLDSLKDFLSVYADYRLKLEQAQEEGLDNDPQVKKEIVGYRQMLAGPFVLEKEVTDPAIRELYARRQWDYHAGHYLAAVKNWNNPADTLRAYNRVLQAMKMLNDGYPFAYVCMSPETRAVIYRGDLGVMHGEKLDTTQIENWPGSDDKTSASAGGDLGFFMPGMTVRPFEDALVKLQPGTYTRVPVKTRYGYHIIWLYEKEPHTGGVHVEHILISVPKIGGIDTESFYHRADSLLKAIRNGANFEEVARESSNDKSTSIKGGDMDTIDHETRRTELPFDRTAYALKDGEISGLVRTSFGYHIIKRVNGVRGHTFEESKDHLEQFYKHYYFDEDRAQFIDSLEKANHFRFDSTTLDYVMAHIDSSRTSADSSWSSKLTDRSKTIFRIGDINWTVATLVDSLSAAPGTPLARNQLRDIIHKNSENTALMIEAKNIPARYPEFEKIMDDYKNGIVLFDLENKRVWSKVVPDSANEQKYYEAHKASFIWPERVDL